MRCVESLPRNVLTNCEVRERIRLFLTLDHFSVTAAGVLSVNTLPRPIVTDDWSS